MNADDVALVGALCFQFPALLALLQEHLDDYDGVLPHVLMGDVTRWVVGRFREDESDTIALQVLNFLNTAFENERSTELISVSFLENLPRGAEGSALRSALGPELRSQLQRMGF